MHLISAHLLRSRTLGDWSEPFFGAEQQRQRYDLERLKIADDQALTDEQKKKRLVALEQKLPSKVQEERIKSNSSRMLL